MRHSVTSKQEKDGFIAQSRPDPTPQLHNTHLPNEAPQRFIDLYNYNDTFKNTFYGMVSVVDETVANITTALKVGEAAAAHHWPTFC